MPQSNVAINEMALTLPLFSICTIVSTDTQYQKMKQSFEACDFKNDCEYLVADNREKNEWDAYRAITWFLEQSKAQYIIIVHQDVICKDSKAELLDTLADLEKLDNQWAVCGNAGCSGYKKCYFHLINAGKKKLSAHLPKKVSSLDENFLLVKTDRKPKMTTGLSGFHLYGTDICINALNDGHTAYVIPFLVEHLSLGNLADLDKFVPSFISAHSNSKPGQFVQTTCTKFYLGETPAQTKAYNSSFRFGLIKIRERIKGWFT